MIGFLESNLRLAQGASSSRNRLVPPTPAVCLPSVGTHRRAGPARENDPLHGEQLLGARVLPRMAPLIQRLDRALPLHPARRPAAPRNHQHLIFTLVSLWHDLSPKLLAWAGSQRCSSCQRSSRGRGSRRRWCVFAWWKKHGRLDFYSSCTVRGQVEVPSRVFGWRGVQRPADEGRQSGQVRSWRRRREILCAGARQQLGGYVVLFSESLC
jgi:hypothetical protein